MGYRSDVAIKIYGTKERMQELKDYADGLVEALDPDFVAYVLNPLIESSEEIVDRELWEFDDDDDASFLFFAEWVKWYDFIPEVVFCQSIFEKAKEIGEADFSLVGEYVRIGEEPNDNQEERFNADDDHQLTIRRSIEF